MNGRSEVAEQRCPYTESHGGRYVWRCTQPAGHRGGHHMAVEVDSDAA